MLLTDLWGPGVEVIDPFFIIGESMNLKEPLSFDKQVAKLQKHGLIIDDLDRAKSIIQEINYYRFTGYALEFRKSKSDSDYISNTSFDSVYNIYLFDEDLRILLLKYLLPIEIFFRTQISYGFSTNKCNEKPHDQHYDINNYYNKKSIVKIFESIKREIGYHKDSEIVKHHKVTYANKMPLWVLVELISFSNLSKYYSSLHYNDQKIISKQLKFNNINLSNWLHCLSVLRNMCAHSNRLYNKKFKPPVKLGRGFLKANPDLSNDTLFSYIIVMMRTLPNSILKNNFKCEFIELINKHKDNINLKKIGIIEDFENLL